MNIKAVVAAVTGMLLSISAVAQDFADPMRPQGARIADAVDAVPTGPVLQSTLIGPGSKRATISGKTYSVGDRVGTAVITDIRAYEIVLDQGGRETRMRLVPPLAKEAKLPAAETKRTNP